MRGKSGQFGLNSGKMKFCPGDACGVWLPCYQFAINHNTGDGFDTYCVECNKRKRESKRIFRERFSNPESRDDSVEIEDAFVSFCKSKDAMEESKKNARFDSYTRTLLKIDRALVKARLHQGFSTPFDSSMLYSKLFNGRKLVCDITGQPITESCFADHHDLEFKRNGKRLDVICTDAHSPF